MKFLAIVVVALMVACVGATKTSASSNDKWIKSGLICIHHYEGAWNSNTGNGYYGGLQMDYNFQKAYGKYFLRKWGTANHWPIWAQLQAGVNGAKARNGFNPWPNTALACKLDLFW